MEREPIPKQVWQTAAVVLLGPLMTQLDSTVVNLSLSTIQRDFHASIDTVQWVITGYLLALAMALPMSAWFVDKVGAKRFYMWCFSGFTIASLLCGFSSNITALIGARILQGIAGGLLTPMMQLMMIRVAGNRMAKVLGYTAMPVLMAPLFGPLLAGAILKQASWPWLFYINLPIGIVALVVAALLLPADEPDANRSFDFAGFALISPGLAFFLFGLSNSFTQTGLICLVAGAIFLVLFVVHSAKLTTSALIDVQLFKVRDFANTAIALFLNTGSMFAGQMLIPLYLISGCNLSPAGAGSLVAVTGIGMLCSYPCIGYLVERIGPRLVAVSGVSLVILGTVPIFLMANSHLIMPLMVACLFVRGLGQGGIGIPVLSTGYSEIPRETLSQATTASNIFDRIGGPVATTVMAILMSFSNQSNISVGRVYALPFAALIGLQLVLLCFALRISRSGMLSRPDRSSLMAPLTGPSR